MMTTSRPMGPVALVAALGIAFLLPAQEETALEGVERLPVPDEVEREISRETILKLYRSDYANKSLEGRRELVRKLLVQAEIDSDPATRYTLLEEVRTIAAEIGDAERALAAVTKLARSYEIDEAARKRSTIESIPTGRVKGLEALVLTEAWLELADESFADISYSAAVDAADRAIRSSVRSRLRWLTAAAKARKKELDTVHREYRRVEEAILAAGRGSANPEESLAAGTFFCVWARDWSRGLPLLLKSADETLKPLAEQELAAPTESSECKLLGDIWWKLASKARKQTKISYFERAGHWYGRALPGLSGLETVAIEKRLRQISTLVPKGSSVPLANLKALCWKEGRWREYPANVMTVSIEGDELSVVNTSRIHSRAKLACLRNLEEDFSACLEIRGGHTIGLSSAMGEDRQLSIGGEGQWRKIRIRRVNGELRFSIDGEMVAHKEHKATADMPGVLCVTLLEDQRCEIRRLDLLGG